jgi:hypothetical protein
MSGRTSYAIHRVSRGKALRPVDSLLFLDSLQAVALELPAAASAEAKHAQLRS